MSQLLRTLSRDLIISSHLFSSLQTQRSQNNSPQAEPSPQKHSVITSLYLILKISFLILIFFSPNIPICSFLGEIGASHLTRLMFPCDHGHLELWVLLPSFRRPSVYRDPQSPSLSPVDGLASAGGRGDHSSRAVPGRVVTP